MDDTHLLDQLARHLSDARHRMTALAYELTVARLLLTSADHRFVPGALREVARTVASLRAEDRADDGVVGALTDACRVDTDLRLDQLARTAPPPFDHVFADHLAALRTLTAEIRDAAQAHPALARCDLGVVTERLDRLTGTAPAAAPDAAQDAVPGGVTARRVDEVADEAASRAIARTPPPSLVAFLA